MKHIPERTYIKKYYKAHFDCFLCYWHCFRVVLVVSSAAASWNGISGSHVLQCLNQSTLYHEDIPKSILKRTLIITLYCKEIAHFTESVFIPTHITLTAHNTKMRKAC